MKKLRVLDGFENETFGCIQLDNMLVQFNRIGVHIEGRACSLAINTEDLIITKVHSGGGVVVYTDNLEIGIAPTGEMAIITSYINAVVLEKDERVIATTINGLVIPSPRNFNETHKESKVEEEIKEEVKEKEYIKVEEEIIKDGVDIGDIELSNYKNNEEVNIKYQEETAEEVKEEEEKVQEETVEEDKKEEVTTETEEMPGDPDWEEEKKEEIKEETEEETIARVQKEAAEIFSEMDFGKGGAFDDKLDEWVGGGTKDKKKDIIELINASRENVVEKFVDHMKEVFIEVGTKIGLDNCNEAEKALFGQELRLALAGAKEIGNPRDLEGAASIEEYVISAYKTLRKYTGAFKGMISSELVK